eukprot:1147327-Pelagomonas_calceolata.AAC.1
MQKRHLCSEQESLRRFLGVKSTATNWPALRECGQEFSQFHCFWASVKFLNIMLDSNSETLRQVLKAEFCRGFEVQTVEGLEGSGCPQFPRSEHESSDLPSFKLHTRGVKVKSYKWLGGSNVCDKCEIAEVQGE